MFADPEAVEKPKVQERMLKIWFQEAEFKQMQMATKVSDSQRSVGEMAKIRIGIQLVGVPS